MTKLTPLERKHIKADPDIVAGCQEMRTKVENPNRLPRIRLVKGIYKQVDETEIETLCFPPWEIGYQVLADRLKPGEFIRNIFIKLPNEDITKVSEADMGMILLSTKCLIDEQQGPIELNRIAFDCIKFAQRFQIWYLYKDPNLRKGQGNA